MMAKQGNFSYNDLDHIILGASPSASITVFKTKCMHATDCICESIIIAY